MTATDIVQATVAGTPADSAACPSQARPVDLVHLARQTLGDAALEREVLAMFSHQLTGVRARIEAADEAERRRLAHGLVGSARGIGAFGLAECAAEIEARPAAGEAMARFAVLADEVNAFISALER